MSEPTYSNEAKIDPRHANKLFREYKATKSEKAREEIILLHLPVVRHVARRYLHKKGIPLESLVSIGTIALIRAVDRYKPERGASFSTYVSAVIAGEIRHYLRKRSWALKVPRQLQENFLLVNKAIGELTQEHGRSPTIAQIARKTGLSEEDVLESLEVGRAYHPVSMDAPCVSESGDEFKLSDLVGAEDKGFERLRQKMDVEEILNKLDKRDRLIITLRYYEDLSQQQLASRLGMSQMHVSRLLRRALKKLRDTLQH